jgi:hypothetical protein
LLGDCQPSRTEVASLAKGLSTQEDPIGLAGGLNLYGYADGDPVNNSDPFGLCTAPQVGLNILRCALGLSRVPAVAPSSNGVHDRSIGGSLRIGPLVTSFDVGTTSGLTFSQSACINCTTPVSLDLHAEVRVRDGKAGGITAALGPVSVGNGSAGISVGTPDACLPAVCLFAAVPESKSTTRSNQAPPVSADATAVTSPRRP